MPDRPANRMSIDSKTPQRRMRRGHAKAKSCNSTMLHVTTCRLVALFPVPIIAQPPVPTANGSLPAELARLYMKVCRLTPTNT